jgi:hypothetical protein
VVTDGRETVSESAADRQRPEPIDCGPKNAVQVDRTLPLEIV